jgi:GNAT superfamily N-acetyltransferase
MAQDSTVVRRATTADAADVFALVEEYYEAVSVIVRDDRATLTAYLTDADSGVWLAYHQAHAVGCVLYHPLSASDRSGEVKRMYVQPAFRRLGLARRLLGELEHFAGGRGDRWLYLDTNDSLKTALAFYERHGYRPCPRYNDNPQATIFMRKNLEVTARGGRTP